jgi:hypothetical protein
MISFTTVNKKRTAKLHLQRESLNGQQKQYNQPDPAHLDGSLLKDKNGGLPLSMFAHI